jgi:hypothetical protein
MARRVDYAARRGNRKFNLAGNSPLGEDQNE